MRQIEELERAPLFTSTVVKVQFPDRTAALAAFHPREPFSAVLALVASLLAPGLALELFVTPPRRVLSDGAATLESLGLVPAALLHASFAAGGGVGPGSSSSSGGGGQGGQVGPEVPWYLSELGRSLLSIDAAAPCAFPASARLAASTKPDQVLHPIRNYWL